MTSKFGVTSFELLKCYLSHILALLSEKLEKKKKPLNEKVITDFKGLSTNY